MAWDLVFSIPCFQSPIILTFASLSERFGSYTNTLSLGINWLARIGFFSSGASTSSITTVVETRIAFISFVNVFIPSPILLKKHIAWGRSRFRLNGLWNGSLDILVLSSDSHQTHFGTLLHKQDALPSPMRSLLCGRTSNTPKAAPEGPRISAVDIYY